MDSSARGLVGLLLLLAGCDGGERVDPAEALCARFGECFPPIGEEDCLAIYGHFAVREGCGDLSCEELGGEGLSELCLYPCETENEYGCIDRDTLGLCVSFPLAGSMIYMVVQECGCAGGESQGCVEYPSGRPMCSCT